MKAFLVFLLIVHGLVHFLGAAHGWGLLHLANFHSPITAPLGALWAISGLLFPLFAISWYRRATVTTWIAGTLAIALSQSLIGAAWADAKWGTWGNVLAFTVLLYSLASTGPWSLRARFDETLRALRFPEGRPVSAALLSQLPTPVAKYLLVSGAAKVRSANSFSARMKGRIRKGPQNPYMPFEAEQVNFIDPPARLFFMKAKMAGLPVDVLHVYVDGQASMDVRLLSLFPLVHAEGPELTRSETVTLFNDLCLLAPFGLLSDRVRWEGKDTFRAVGHFCCGNNTVSAELSFDEHGRLVDFRSEDRLRLDADGTFESQGWSTPVDGYENFGPLELMRSGKAVWHPPEGSYPYIELELLDYHLAPTGARESSGPDQHHLRSGDVSVRAVIQQQQPREAGRQRDVSKPFASATPAR